MEQGPDHTKRPAKKRKGEATEPKTCVMFTYANLYTWTEDNGVYHFVIPVDELPADVERLLKEINGKTNEDLFNENPDGSTENDKDAAVEEMRYDFLPKYEYQPGETPWEPVFIKELYTYTVYEF